MKQLAFLVLLILYACTKQKQAGEKLPIKQLKIGESFEWRLDSIAVEEVQAYHCDIIDIDAFSANKELVEAFHKQGIKVIAYLSVGTLESYRPDSNLLPKEIIGNIYPDWPDERFLNIREIEKIKPFILSRLDMIQEKGFDGIEPDNMDGYGEVNGFDLTLEDTRIFCEWLIDEAHKRGLSIGQKNTEELISTMYKRFDWALTEDLFYQHNENVFSPYICSGKPVFCAEYTDRMNPAEFTQKVCYKAKKLNYYPFLKHRDLTKWNYACN